MRPRLLRDPFVHFLALGAGLFALYFAVNPGAEPRAERIVVDERQLEHLATGFQRTWRRPPTRQELAGLVEEHVKEEVLYREALALGLDRDDVVIRRRLRQKMEFINSDLTEPPPPTEAELQSYLGAHAAEFRISSRVSFRHVFLDRGPDDGAALQQARDLLARLNDNPNLTTGAHALSDPTLLPAGLENASPDDIRDRFGTLVADALATAPIDEWSGPIESGFGQHLVLVTNRQPGRTPSLDEVRPAVERAWTAARHREINDGVFQALRDRYIVEIDAVEDLGEPGQPDDTRTSGSRDSLAADQPLARQ